MTNLPHALKQYDGHKQIVILSKHFSKFNICYIFISMHSGQ